MFTRKETLSIIPCALNPRGITKSLISRLHTFQLDSEKATWYQDEKYVVKYIKQNNQFLRLRYYDDFLLNIIAGELNQREANRPKNRRACIVQKNNDIYQPFYPESFHQYWKVYHKNVNFDEEYNYLFIGNEYKLGAVESFALYAELYDKYNCVSNIDVWMQNDSVYDPFTNKYTLLRPAIDCLNQLYIVNFLENTKELKQYDFIVIDLISKFDDVYEWSSVEKDLHNTIAYLIKALRCLKNGKIAVKCTTYTTENWNVLFQILSQNFNEMTTVWPDLVCYSPNVTYIFSERKNQDLNTVMYNIFECLDRVKIYEFMNLAPNHDCKFYKIHTENIINWIKKIDDVRSNKAAHPYRESLLYPEYGHYLFDYCYPLGDKIPRFIGSESQPVIKLAQHLIPNGERESDTFQDKFMEWKCRLRYIKKAIDTRPNHMFSDNTYETRFNEPILSWEQFTWNTSFFKDLKICLKDTHKMSITKGWAKMYEILHCMGEFDDDVSALHLCEAPGNFILACEHFFHKQKKNYGYIAHDYNTKRSILNHVQSDNWMTGDIRKSNVIRNISEKLKNINFITADASIALGPLDINNEEEIMCKTFMGEVISILACLSIGGRAVLRLVLPAVENLTICMINIVSHYFEMNRIYKAIVSNNYNSEFYLILTGFKGIEKSELKKLYKYLDDPNVTNQTVIVNNMDMIFLDNYYNEISYHIKKQGYSIYQKLLEYNDSNRSNISEIYYKGNRIRFDIVDWLSQFPI